MEIEREIIKKCNKLKEKLKCTYYAVLQNQCPHFVCSIFF